MLTAINFQEFGATPERIARELPYAMVFANNRSTEEALLAAHDVARRRLIIREPKFLRDVFRLRRRASVAEYRAKGVIETTAGLRGSDFRGRASVFTEHETGGVRLSSGTRAGYLYVPTWGTTLRPTVRDRMPRAWYPKALGLADRRAIDGSLTLGEDKTRKRRGSTRGARKDVKAFVIRSRITRQPIAIARRLAPGRRLDGRRDLNVEILFMTYQRRAIQPRLDFGKTFDRVGLERQQENVRGMLVWALDRARQRSTRAAEAQTRLDLFGPQGLQRRNQWRLSSFGVR